MKRIACIRLIGDDDGLPLDDSREAIVECCGRYTPIVGFEATDRRSVLLDITGLAHLFGGEAAMIEGVVGDLAQLGFAVRAAVADTIGAAWAAVHYGGLKNVNCKLKNANLKSPTGVSTEPISNFQFAIYIFQSLTFLHSLPVESLRLPPDTLRVLHDLGLTRVGQLEAIPRGEFLSRFGPGLLRRMDQAFGRLDEPVSACSLPPKFAVRWSVEYPTARRETIAAGIEGMIARVAAMLARCGRGALRLDCRLEVEGDGQRVDVQEAGRRPVNGPDSLARTRIREPGVNAGPKTAFGGKGRKRPCIVQDERLCGVQDSHLCESQDARLCDVQDERLNDVAWSSLNSRTHSRRNSVVRNQQAGHCLCQAVAHQGEGVRGLPLSVGLFQPTADAKRLFELVELQLERMRIGSPVTAVHVAATLTAPLEPRKQATLFELDDDSRQPRRLAGLIERLASRLGAKAVVGVRLRPEAQPEFSWHYDPLVGVRRRRSVGKQLPADLPPRPLRLLSRPAALAVTSIAPDGPLLRFLFNGEEHSVARSWGPERIETGWWRGHPIGRDYFRIETVTAGRYWLFRRLRDGKWFLHGTFE